MEKQLRYDCLCLGACVLDEYPQNKHEQLGGDAANQAVMLHRLGLTPLLAAGIGQDESGQRIFHRIKQEGLDPDGLIVGRHWTTTHSIVTLDERGERRFQVVGGAHRQLQKSDLDFAWLDRCRAVSLGSLFTLNDLEEDGLLEFLQAAKEKGRLVFSDTTRDRHHKGLMKASRFFSLFDFFMPSYEEARELCNQSDPDAIAEVLFGAGVRALVLKLGENGAAFYQNGRKLWLPADPATVKDTCGAGDNFCAGFIASILSHLPPEKALRNACWMGARAVETLGAHPRINKASLPYPLFR